MSPSVAANAPRPCQFNMLIGQSCRTVDDDFRKTRGSDPLDATTGRLLGKAPFEVVKVVVSFCSGLSLLLFLSLCLLETLLSLDLPVVVATYMKGKVCNV